VEPLLNYKPLSQQYCNPQEEEQEHHEVFTGPFLLC